ncbi:MAG: polysaccharide deacetylase family protein [Oscillospiraceae bacterium]|nr:polysaccharide deacetylase family protein [Oscillospiraceae bacterium]
MDSRKLIALTFDDGPNTTTTMQVLDLIEQYGITASFYVVGNNINDESKAAMIRAVSLGCEIENHSQTHSAMPEMTAEEIEAEINFTSDRIEAVTGRKPKFFRPPYIAFNQLMYDTIDLTFICGNGAEDYLDEVTPEMRYERIMKQVCDGMIILLHDAEGNFRTVEALKMLIPKLLDEGYEFVTTTQLFERNGVVPQKNTIYTNVHQ